MKLIEIFDTLSKKTSKSPEKVKGIYRNKLGAVKIGKSGQYSDAYEFPDSPHRKNEIVKVSKERNEEFYDPFEAYIEMVENFKKAGGQNPYFPRVISHQSYRRNGKIYNKSRVEKLYPLDTPKIIENEELMSSLIEDMFTKGIMYNSNPVEFITDQITAAVKGNFGLIKDPELLEACKMINKLWRDWGTETFMIDTHSGNLLWRITGNRPQLVLNDPIGSYEY
jgi:hypothetical protein